MSTAPSPDDAAYWYACWLRAAHERAEAQALAESQAARIAALEAGILERYTEEGDRVPGLVVVDGDYVTALEAKVARVESMPLVEPRAEWLRQHWTAFRLGTEKQREATLAAMSMEDPA